MSAVVRIDCVCGESFEAPVYARPVPEAALAEVDEVISLPDGWGIMEDEDGDNYILCPDCITERTETP